MPLTITIFIMSITLNLEHWLVKIITHYGQEKECIDFVITKLEKCIVLLCILNLKSLWNLMQFLKTILQLISMSDKYIYL